MKNSSWFEKFKERKIGQALAIYLGSAWVFIEVINFVVDKYRLNTTILDILILLVIFGFPAILIYAWFQQKFTRKAIILQAISGIIGLSIIVFTLVNPGRLNPTQLRLLKFKENQKDLAQKIGSIAILPFNNFTGDEDQAYLASGMHDALISELGQIGAIRVISRTSTLAYANSEKTIKEIASELNVDAIIEASLLGADESIRVQLKLINAFPVEQQLWSQTYDTNMDNILNLYNNVLKNIADEIHLTLSPELETKLEKAREINPEAYKAYLRGMYQLKQLTPESTKRGLEYLHEAIQIDPTEPFAYAGLALGYLEIAHSPLDPGDALTKAEAAANQAVKLDSTMVEVYAAFGEVYLYSLWKFELAEKYLVKALEINPNLAIIHYHYAWALYLFGRMDEAIAEHKLAQKLDPFDASYASLTGALYYFDGQYEKALEEVNISFELQKDHSYGYWVLGNTYLKMGKTDEAIEAHEKLAEVHPWWTSALGYTYAVTGHVDEAKEILKNLENGNINPWVAWQCATVNAGLGNKDEAFKWMNHEPHHAFHAWCSVLPEFESLHDDPRFEEFLERLNIPE